MNFSVSDVVDIDSDLETTATPTDAEIVGLPSCASSTSQKTKTTVDMNWKSETSYHASKS